MSNPSKDPKFNDALKRMIASPPKQNKDIKAPRPEAKSKKEPKPWAWSKR